MATIQEAYKITDDELDALDEKAQESDYWDKAYNFVLQVIDKNLETISDKQQVWLETILHEVR